MFEIQSNYEYDGKYYIEIDCGEFYTTDKSKYEKTIKDGFITLNNKDHTWVKFN